MKKKVELRLCSSAALKSAVEEAKTLCRDPAAEGLCRNACLLAQAVYRGKRRLFRSGAEVLRRLPAEAIACWMEAYAELCRSQDWKKRLEVLRQDAEGRLRWKVLRAFGVLPTAGNAEPDRKTLTDCVLQMLLDQEEQLAALCPDCREHLLDGACPVCGAVQFGENPAFDPARFEELKNNGLSHMGPSVP